MVSLMLLNLAGGDCVDDIRILEKDEGFCKILGRVETKGLTRQQRRVLERRWRKERHRCVPSPSALFRYLEAFHDPEEEKKREPGKAFIPALNEHLQGLRKANLICTLDGRWIISKRVLSMSRGPFEGDGPFGS